MAREGFGTDPSGILARGAPSAGGGGRNFGVGIGGGTVSPNWSNGPMMRFKKSFKEGGKISAAEAVHKHERNMHKGKKPTKFAKGGSTASKRADGCATKGKTKGRIV